MTQFKAHGVVYSNEAEACNRIAVLEDANNVPGVGPSDGRVTEIMAIKEALSIQA